MQQYAIEIGLSKALTEKTEKQCSFLCYIHSNCIVIISYNIYYAHNVLHNFILQKPRTIYPKNSENDVITGLPVERFSPKVDRHQFMLQWLAKLLGIFFIFTFFQNTQNLLNGIPLNFRGANNIHRPIHFNQDFASRLIRMATAN